MLGKPEPAVTEALAVSSQVDRVTQRVARSRAGADRSQIKNGERNHATRPRASQNGSAGTGGLGHLAQELFKLHTKIDITHVPYKGSGPVMTALLAGEVNSSFSSVVPSIPHVKAGRLRAIGVTPPRRIRALPDVPTINETVPGFEVIHWYGIFGPKGIRRDIVARLNKEFATVLASSSIRQWLEGEGMEPAGGPPEQFRNRIKGDVEKWKRLVKDANIKMAL